MSSFAYNLGGPLCLCINKDDTKKVVDCIAIVKDSDNLFKVWFNADYQVDQVKFAQPVMTKKTRENVLEYLQDCMDLLQADKDKISPSIDVKIPGRPIVSLDTMADTTAPLILRTVSNWCIQT